MLFVRSASSASEPSQDGAPDPTIPADPSCLAAMDTLLRCREERTPGPEELHLSNQTERTGPSLSKSVSLARQQKIGEGRRGAQGRRRGRRARASGGGPPPL